MNDGYNNSRRIAETMETYKVTVEMALGHILQNLIKVHAATETLDTSLYGLRGDVDALMAHTGAKPRSQGKRKARG